MKNLVFAFALLCSTTLVAQFSFNENGTGIQSPTNTASGSYSTAMGVGTTASGYAAAAMGAEAIASGNNSIAMGESLTASGTVSIAMGKGTTASGWASTAMGQGTTASGAQSTAMGYQTEASGDFSTAMGSGTTANAYSSIAMGGGTTANGNYSTASGGATTAEDYLSFVIGVHNKTDETPNPDSFSYQNTAFVIGNGGYDSEGNYVGTSDTFSNAFEVLFDGSTTIAGNVTAPAFIGDGSQLTNLPTPSVDYGDVTNVPLIFNGNETGVQTPTNTASGDYSTAMGEGTEASGNASTAMGEGTEASGNASTAMGNETIASGGRSTAMGELTTASGYIATAMGYYTTANGAQSTAMGAFTMASGTQSTAMGTGTIASGNLSTAMGWNTNAQDFGATAIGTNSKIDESPNPSEFSLQNTAFIIGNGDSFNNRSNAFEVLFDGTTTIAGDLNINSDARLKANIISLGATLSKLLQIDGKTYTMKKDANHKKKIGLLAQDIEKVFPELVTETNDIKSVNYQGLVPVLINAMKEQDDKITKQQQEIDELKAMVKALAKG